MFSSLIGIAALAFLSPLVSCGQGHLQHANRHHDLAKRAAGEIHLYKRFGNSRWSFYDVEVGAGACGVWNKPSDFTVALNADQFGNPTQWPGPECFKTITMRYNGKIATATVMDKCPGCPYGGLDLTRGLFSYFDTQDKGIIYGEWWFGGEEIKQTTTTKATTTWKLEPTTSWKPEPTATWKPEPTATWKPEPTTTWTPEPTTTWAAATSTKKSSSIISTWSSLAEVSTAKGTISTSSAASSASSSSSSSSVSLSASISGLALPTGKIDRSPSQPQNLNALNNFFINLGSLIEAGTRA